MNTQTHLSFKVSKRLKEFLGESAPEPIKSEMGQVWLYDMECPDDGLLQGVSLTETDAPAYQLHDLLSKPFCEAMAKKSLDESENLGTMPDCTEIVADYLYRDLATDYYDGGLPAVEKALIALMEAK